MTAIAIFDLDATLNASEDRDRTIVHPMSAANWDAYHSAHVQDEPSNIVFMAIALQRAGYRIIILTGRNEKHYATTRRQLNNWGILPDLILMRPDFCHEPAAKMKVRLLVQNLSIKELASIAFVVDDHAGVCSELHEYGLTTLQVRLAKKEK